MLATRVHACCRGMRPNPLLVLGVATSVANVVEIRNSANSEVANLRWRVWREHFVPRPDRLEREQRVHCERSALSAVALKRHPYVPSVHRPQGVAC